MYSRYVTEVDPTAKMAKGPTSVDGLRIERLRGLWQERETHEGNRGEISGSSGTA
jgi:hypothetical protein